MGKVEVEVELEKWQTAAASSVEMAMQARTSGKLDLLGGRTIGSSL